MPCRATNAALDATVTMAPRRPGTNLPTIARETCMTPVALTASVKDQSYSPMSTGPASVTSVR